MNGASLFKENGASVSSKGMELVYLVGDGASYLVGEWSECI